MFFSIGARDFEMSKTQWQFRLEKIYYFLSTSQPIPSMRKPRRQGGTKEGGKQERPKEQSGSGQPNSNNNQFTRRFSDFGRSVALLRA